MKPLEKGGFQKREKEDGRREDEATYLHKAIILTIFETTESFVNDTLCMIIHNFFIGKIN